MLLSLRYTAWTLATLVRIPFALPSATQMQFLVSKIAGHNRSTAKAVADCLQSNMGLQQMLALARDELVHISTDKWDDDIWGIVAADAAATKNAQTAKLFLYFLEKDSWIADETRDMIVAARASTGKPGEEDKPFMEIDDNGVLHDFVSRDDHVKIVAEKTAGYLEKIVLEKWR